jgi:hypothetical protein
VLYISAASPPKNGDYPKIPPASEASQREYPPRRSGEWRARPAGENGDVFLSGTEDFFSERHRNPPDVKVGWGGSRDFQEDLCSYGRIFFFFSCHSITLQGSRPMYVSADTIDTVMQQTLIVKLFFITWRVFGSSNLTPCCHALHDVTSLTCDSASYQAASMVALKFCLKELKRQLSHTPKSVAWVIIEGKRTLFQVGVTARATQVHFPSVNTGELLPLILTLHENLAINRCCAIWEEISSSTARFYDMNLWRTCMIHLLQRAVFNRSTE